MPLARKHGFAARYSGGGSGGLGSTGDVVGPASAVDSRLALYDGTSGKLIKVGSLAESAISQVGHTHSAATDLTGTIADSRLPNRLKEAAPLVADLNAGDALLSGWCSATNATSNTPDTSFWVVEVAWYGADVVGGNWVVQHAHEVVSPFRSFKRTKNVATWGSWVELETGGGATNLDGLSDVVITSPATGEVLRFNGTSWVDAALTNADVGLGNVDNVSAANLRDRSTHTGTQSADSLVDGSTNHVFTAADDTKLAGIATGATANDTDANLKNRANHTGTQAAGTITGLATVATSGSAADLTGTLDNARLDTELQALAGLTSAANKLPYFTGSGTAQVTDFPLYSRALVACTDAATWREGLGVTPPGLHYTWSTNTDTYSDPGAGFVRYGDDSLFAIDFTDADAVDRSAYLNTITSTSSGTLTIHGLNGGVGIAMVAYTGTPGTYIQLNSIGDSAISFANNEQVFITFALSG